MSFQPLGSADQAGADRVGPDEQPTQVVEDILIFIAPNDGDLAANSTIADTIGYLSRTRGSKPNTSAVLENMENHWDGAQLVVAAHRAADPSEDTDPSLRFDGR